jgi:transposase
LQLLTPQLSTDTPAFFARARKSQLRDRGIDPKIPKRRTEHGSGLGVYRWVVERTNAWLHSFRKLRLRTDPDGAIHKAFVSLGSALICMWFL